MMINFYKIENFIDYVFDASHERIGRMIPGTKIINSQNINKNQTMQLCLLIIIKKKF